MEVLTVLFCTTACVKVISLRLALHYTAQCTAHSLRDTNFSCKASLNFPLYPQLFNCYHKPSRFNPGGQSSSLPIQRLMPFHREAQTHELSRGFHSAEPSPQQPARQVPTHPHPPPARGQSCLLAALHTSSASSSSSLETFSSSTLSYVRADGVRCFYLEQCSAKPEILSLTCL